MMEWRRRKGSRRGENWVEEGVEECIGAGVEDPVEEGVEIGVERGGGIRLIGWRLESKKSAEETVSKLVEDTLVVG